MLEFIFIYLRNQKSLKEIEEQLEIAENRCNTLKGQLDCMKKIYHKTSKNDSLQPSKGPETTPYNTKTDTFAPKNSRKRPSSPPTNLNKTRPVSPTIKRPVPEDFHESTDTLPQKSSSSSSAAPVNSISVIRPKEPFSVPLMRQNSSSIGTDHTGAAVKTINNILTGITDSVNRLSQLHVRENKIKKSEERFKDVSCGVTENGIIVTVPIKPSFSPRMTKRIREQQKKVEEIARAMDIPQEPQTTEIWTNAKSKAPHVPLTWSRHTSVKNSIATPKTKIQCSSGSVNLARNFKSTAKHVENTTKLHSVRTTMVDDESQSATLSRKRKRTVKRLKPTSRMSLGQKYSSHSGHKRFEQFTSDNLVELYHNVAAKGSDSDDSNNEKKSMVLRQKGGGDLTISPNPVISMEVTNEEALPTKPVSKLFQSSRFLTPINEHGFAEPEPAITKTECFANVSRNYELPTIASKMKQVTKCYLQSFNFRSIPFCAAKSTTPSHNIGINIQQVMSIIKTRQPITGISPTLAHNISLAAGKLQSRPLSALVSTLSSKIGYGRSQCPLSRSPLNYSQLQEMAREIQEEPFEEEIGFEDNQNETTDNPGLLVNRPAGDTEIDGNPSRTFQKFQEPNQTTIWSVDPSRQQRCTCAYQKGIPFQQVLNRFQMSSDTVNAGIRPQNVKYTLPPIHRKIKSTFNPFSRKQRTRNWIKGDNNSQAVISKQSATNALKGNEKNLATVLRNLHDEFDNLNTKYEELAKQASQNEASEETLKELEDMEKALNKKEEEINMVMSLYTEVLALKDQVKKLRERTSQASVILTQNASKTSDYKEPKAALHLTQLLRQIQNYQMHCKNKV